MSERENSSPWQQKWEPMKPATFQFHGPDGPILIIHLDKDTGIFELPDGMPDSERAQAFFTVLEQLGVNLRREGSRAGQEDMKRRAVEVADGYAKANFSARPFTSYTEGRAHASEAIASVIFDLEVRDE